MPERTRPFRARSPLLRHSTRHPPRGPGRHSMILGRKWDIHTRTQLISVGPALLLTLLLTGFFTYTRIQDLRYELNQAGQLMANQLAPAAAHGVAVGDTEMLETLLRATLRTPNV